MCKLIYLILIICLYMVYVSFKKKKLSAYYFSFITKINSRIIVYMQLQYSSFVHWVFGSQYNVINEEGLALCDGGGVVGFLTFTIYIYIRISTRVETHLLFTQQIADILSRRHTALGYIDLQFHSQGTQTHIVKILESGLFLLRKLYTRTSI